MLCVLDVPISKIPKSINCYGLSDFSGKISVQREYSGPPQTFGFNTTRDEAERQMYSFIEAAEDRSSMSAHAHMHTHTQAHSHTHSHTHIQSKEEHRRQCELRIKQDTSKEDVKVISMSYPSTFFL